MCVKGNSSFQDLQPLQSQAEKSNSPPSSYSLVTPAGRNSPPHHRWAPQSRSPRRPVVPLRNPHIPSHLHLHSLLLAHHLGRGFCPCLTHPLQPSCAPCSPRSLTITAQLLLPWNLSKYTQASNLPCFPLAVPSTDHPNPNALVKPQAGWSQGHSSHWLLVLKAESAWVRSGGWVLALVWELNCTSGHVTGCCVSFLELVWIVSFDLTEIS